MHSRLNTLFLATAAIYLIVGLSPARAAKAAPRPAIAPPAAAEDPIKTVTGRHVTLEFRESDFKLLKSQEDYVAFLDNVYDKMQELTYASPPMILRGHKDLGAWGTAGEDGVRIDWTCVPAFMTGFNTGMIEFGVVHEIGHVFDARSFPRWYITPGCGGETFGNIKLSYALEMLLRKDNAYRIEFGPGGKQTGYDFNNNFYLPAGKSYLAADTAWDKLGVDELHAFHMTLIRRYGWDVYKKWFRAYYLIEAQKDGRAPSSCNDPVRINLVCALLSAFCGENLVPDFKQWRMPVTEASVSEVRRRYQLNDVCADTEKQFAREYAAGKVTLDPLSLRITVDPVPGKTMSKVGFFSVLKTDGAAIRYTLDSSAVGSPFTRTYTGVPVAVNAPATVNAALYLPGKKEPVLKASLKVTPVNTPAAKPVAAATGPDRAWAAPVSFSAAAPVAADGKAEFTFIPWPESVKRAGGELAVTAAGRIIASDKTLAPLAQIVSDELLLLTGVRLLPAVGSAKAGDIVLAIDSKLQPEAAYTVTVGDRVTVTGGAYLGAAHGTALLLQAVRAGKGNFSLPKITVQDRPYSEYYGQMVDIARQNNSLEELKGVVNLMRLYRMRFLQLHMTDDQAWTFPSTAFPKLGKTNWATRGGPVPKVYTVEQWKELVRYADARGVTFVPEIETPGHSGAARRDAPEVFGPDVAVMNMTNPKMYEALDTLIGEVCEVFKSSPYIHIGCDECNIEPISRDANSGEFRKAHGITDGTDLFAWHIAKMNEIVKKHGKRTIAWQDGAFTARVPKDVIIMVWHIDGDNGATPGYVQEGRPVIQVTWTPCVYQPVKDVYEWNAWKKEWPQGGKMLGAQLVLWELSGASAVPLLRYKSAPRGERVWNPYAGLPYPHFAQRLEATDEMLDRLLTGLSVRESGLTLTLGDWLRAGGKGDEASGILPKFAIDDQSTIAFQSAVPGVSIRYTTDGKDPSPAAALYSAPFKLYDSKSGKITVKACAFGKDGKPVGAVWSRDYYFKPLAGTVSGTILPGDRISEPVTVTLTSTMKGQIRYALDGKEPAEQSPVYTAPVKIDKSATLVAGLFVSGKRVGELWRQVFNSVAVVKNLTTGKPVTASGVESGCQAENAVDGIVELQRAWWAGPYPQWIQVDLTQVYKLGSAEVFPYWDGGRYYQYTVELSMDGKAWTKAVDMSANTKPAKPAGDLHTFAPTSARYVRVNMLKNSANVGVHLVELRVFEAK